jgi:hypothetical protein
MSKCEYCGADVRVDDSSPITEDWLRSVGFMPGWGSYLYLNLPHGAIEYRNDHIQSVWILNQQAYPLGWWKTRGDLRLLFRALSSPLPSPPEAGE